MLIWVLALLFTVGGVSLVVMAVRDERIGFPGFFFGSIVAMLGVVLLVLSTLAALTV